MSVAADARARPPPACPAAAGRARCARHLDAVAEHHRAAAAGRGRRAVARRRPRRLLGVGDARARRSTRCKFTIARVARRRRPSTPSAACSWPGCSCATTSAASRSLNALIDLPFALPTIVAGITLLALYGPSSPVGINVAFTKVAVADGADVRDAAVRRARGPAGADGARPRDGGGRGVARRDAGHGLPPDHLPEPRARAAVAARRWRSRARSASSARSCCSAATSRSTPRCRRSTSSSRSRATTPTAPRRWPVVLLLVSLLVLVGIRRSAAGGRAMTLSQRIGLRVARARLPRRAAVRPGRRSSSTGRSSPGSAPSGTRSRRPPRSTRSG